MQLVEQWGPWQEILGLIPGLHRLYFIFKSQKSPRLTPESVQTAKLYEITKESVKKFRNLSQYPCNTHWLTTENVQLFETVKCVWCVKWCTTGALTRTTIAVNETIYNRKLKQKNVCLKVAHIYSLYLLRWQPRWFPRYHRIWNSHRINISFSQHLLLWN